MDDNDSKEEGEEELAPEPDPWYTSMFKSREHEKASSESNSTLDESEDDDDVTSETILNRKLTVIVKKDDETSQLEPYTPTKESRKLMADTYESWYESEDFGVPATRPRFKDLMDQDKPSVPDTARTRKPTNNHNWDETYVSGLERVKLRLRQENISTTKYVEGLSLEGVIEEVHNLENKHPRKQSQKLLKVVSEMKKDVLQYDELIKSRMLLLEKMNVAESKSKRRSAQIQREDSDVWLEF